jgi:hypothetical protein
MAATPAGVAEAVAAPPRGAGRDVYVYLLITALVVGAWGITRLGLYTSKSNVAYWMGVSGGVAMLALLTYPMRKRLRIMRRTGPASRWFAAHMVLGVLGPLLILLHSNFHIGSLNAGVALFAMVLVASSGIVGRFLYLRLHRNLSGGKLTLEQLRASHDADGSETARMRFAPRVVERCRDFERWALDSRVLAGAGIFRAMAVVPAMRWRTELACRAELRRRLVAVAHTEGWSRRKLQSRLKAARRLTHAYLGGTQRVALFSAWERLFSWWHIAHAPFVYILVISAVVHVIAVHAY